METGPVLGPINVQCPIVFAVWTITLSRVVVRNLCDYRLSCRQRYVSLPPFKMLSRYRCATFASVMTATNTSSSGYVRADLPENDHLEARVRSLIRSY